MFMYSSIAYFVVLFRRTDIIILVREKKVRGWERIEI